MEFLKILIGSTGSKQLQCGPALFIQKKCETARTVKTRQSAVPGKTREKLKRFQNFQKQRKPKLPRQMYINKKLGKAFPQIKIKEN